MVTLLLAAAVPFCCCDFRSILSGCASCGGQEQTESDAAVNTETDGSEHCHGMGHEHAAGRGSHGNTDHCPAPGSPKNDKHDCNCGKSDGKMLSVQKFTIDFSVPVVIAVLDWKLAADVLPASAFRIQDRYSSGVQRPPTSLLRQHCALTV